MTTTRAATRNPSDGAMNGATMNGATMNGGRHASIGQGHEGDVGNMKGREGGGEQDEEDDDAEGDDDSYGDGDETEDGVEDPRDVVKEEGKGKGVGREVLLDFSIVSAAASVNQKPATGTGTNATATANSVRGCVGIMDRLFATFLPPRPHSSLPTLLTLGSLYLIVSARSSPSSTYPPSPSPPGPAPATTAGQKPPKIKRTSPHTKPSDLASATRTLASTRSALGEPLANSLVHVSHAPIPRGRTNPTPFTTSPIESLDPMYTGGGTKRARQSETGAPPTKRARSTSVSMGHATAPTHPAPPPQNAPSRQAYGQPHPQQVYMASPRLVPTGAEPYSLSYSPPHPQAQPQTQTTIQPQPPQYTPASSSSSSLAAAAAAYSQQFAQGAGAGGSGQQQQGQRGPEQHQQTGGGHRQATSPAPQGGGQQAYSPYPYPWYYTTAPAGGAWSPYGAAPASAPSAPFPHVPAQPRPPLAQGRPPSAYAHPSPSLAQHTLHTQPRVSQARYAPPEDAGMEDAAPESEEGADEDYEDGEDGDEGVGDGG
ncbi:hypothetical protein B0H19DRAFT_237215 [Mycena capillaripes]|nr:hypothetical protein B0H19DRAFT_237215 [Mycena capillaripes]